MTTLVVQLPPRDAALHAAQWPANTLPFALFDRHARALRVGHASLALLPKAHTTIVLVAARDLLFLNLPLAPLSKARLRAALPNVVEDQLLQDARSCHIALEPIPGRASILHLKTKGAAAPLRARRLAVIDRNWFQSIHTAFAEAGHLRLRAVPLTSCLPSSETEDEISCWRALVYDFDPSDTQSLFVELAFTRGMHGEGLRVPADALADTLAAVTRAAPMTLYQLNHAPDQVARALPASLKARSLSFEALARAALECRFDLCQFEFAAPLWRIPRGARKRWRVPFVLLIATVLIALAGANLDWLLLARQRNVLVAQQTETLLSAFPKTESVLDAPQQMARQLDILRMQAGESAPDDFLSLAQGLARALGQTQERSIEQLHYRNRTLEVLFRADAKLDAAFKQRLMDNGLASRSEGGKWTLSAAPRSDP